MLRAGIGGGETVGLLGGCVEVGRGNGRYFRRWLRIAGGLLGRGRLVRRGAGVGIDNESCE